MNRRQWIFISLLLAAALTSFAQEASDSYRPFVEEGKEWYSSDRVEHKYVQKKVYLRGDTTLYGRQCKKMYLDWIIQGNIIFKGRYIGACYEEAHKVWFFYQEITPGMEYWSQWQEFADLSVPRLLYDFSARAGETLETWEPDPSGIQWKRSLSVTDSRDVLRCGRLWRCVSFIRSEHDDLVNVWENASMNYWIEGIGSPVSPIDATSGNYITDPWPIRLDSCLVNGEKIFSGEDLPSHELTEGVYERVARPFAEDGKEWVTGIFDNDLEAYVQLNTYFFSGDTVVNSMPCSKLMCRTERWQEESKTQLAACIYECDRKVWAFAPGSDDARLLYDFKAWYDSYTSVQLLDSSMSDSVRVKLGFRASRKVGDVFPKSVRVLAFLDSSTVQTEWTEGLGSLHAPLCNIPWPEGSVRERLLQCRAGDTVLFEASDYGSAQDNVLRGLSVILPRAREFRPFVEEGKEWDVALVGTSLNGEYVAGYQHYYFDGDTLIGSQPCKRLMCQYLSPSRTTQKLEYIASVFDDSGKVCFFPQDSIRAQLLFDFGRSAGDELTVQDPYPRVWTIDAYYKDTAIKICGFSDEIKGGHRQQVCWYSTENDKAIRPREFWMSGVGSALGPICFVPMKRSFAAPSYLICCRRGDEILYEYHNFDHLINKIPSLHEEPVSTSHASNKGLFDLSGRLLSAPPAKGVYIENGQKRVAKGR